MLVKQKTKNWRLKADKKSEREGVFKADVQLVMTKFWTVIKKIDHVHGRPEVRTKRQMAMQKTNQWD